MNIREYPNLQRILGFNGRYAKFVANDKQGLVDKSGQVILDAKYNLIMRGIDPDEFMVTEVGRVKHYNVRVGNWVTDYDACKFSNGAIRFAKNGLYGLKINDKVIIPPLYRFIFPDCKNQCSFYLVAQNSKAGKYAIFNLEGNQVTDFIYDRFEFLENSYIPTLPGMSAAVSIGDESFIVDGNGNCLTKTYPYISPFTAAGYAMYKDPFLKKIRIMHRMDNDVMVCCGSTDFSDAWYSTGNLGFKQLKWLSTNRIAFCKENLWGFMNHFGETLLPPQYELIFNEGNDHFILKDKFGLCSCIDADLHVLIPGKYSHLYYEPKFKCYVAKNECGKFGVLAEDASTLIPFEYDHLAISASDGLSLISVKNNNEIYFINEKQERINLF